MLNHLNSLKYNSIYLSLLLITSSCNPLNCKDSFWVTSTISERTDFDVQWQQTRCEECDARVRTDELLNSSLTVNNAVQIALLNNPRLQSQFETIGIARSDVVASLLPHNPVVEWMIRREVHPTAKHLDIESTITGMLWDLFLIPLRYSAANTGLKKSRFMAVHAVLDLMLEVQTTFYLLQASEKKYDAYQVIADIARISEGIAAKENESGNINDLDLEIFQNRYRLAQVNLLQAEKEVIDLKQDLNQLMGLTCPADSWSMTHIDAEIPNDEPDIHELESIALCHRFDLQATRLTFAKTAKLKKLHQWWVYLEPEAGYNWEQNPDGTLEYGPVIMHTLPIFNYGQADRNRLSHTMRQQLKDYQEVYIQVIGEVRKAKEMLTNARETVMLFQKEILPLEEKILHSSLLQYNIMNKGVHDLLEQKQNVIFSEITCAEATSHYWIERSRLEHAVGGAKLIEN